jgi:nitrite reductase/ring-hydroxylating ferredoxin subunit
MGGSVASADGQLIHCQRHAAVFLASTGECVGGPCQGESLDPVGFTLSNGDIYLD